MTKIIKNFKDFKLFEKISITVSDDVAPFNLNKRPQTDQDMEREKSFLLSAIKEFDRIFKTDYHQKFGIDFRLLVGRDEFFSKEAIEALIKEALKYEVYTRFDLSSSDTFDTLYSNILKYKVSETKDDFLDFINSILPNKIDKSKLYYKFFRKVGSEFDNEVIKDVLEFKNSFDLGGDNPRMKEKYQRVFLRGMKHSMNRYQRKVKKGKSSFISTSEFFEGVLSYLDNAEIEDVKKDYVKKRLGDWVSYLKSL